MFALLRSLRRAKALSDLTAENGRLHARIDAAQTRVAQERERHAAQRAADIARLTTRYYAASALTTDDRRRSITASGGHQTGLMHGLTIALAEITGLDEAVVTFRLDHGVPVTSDWIVVNDSPTWDGCDIRLVHDGIRESMTERLDMLHRTALEATGHPAHSAICVPDRARLAS